jgi:hypothetical protein
MSYKQIETRYLGDGRQLIIYEENGVRKEVICELIATDSSPPVKAETLQWKLNQAGRHFACSVTSLATSSFLLSPEFYGGRPCWEVFYSSTVLAPDENRMGSETKYAWDLEGAKAWCQQQADKDFLVAQNAAFEARIRRIWRSWPAR